MGGGPGGLSFTAITKRHASFVFSTAIAIMQLMGLPSLPRGNGKRLSKNCCFGRSFVAGDQDCQAPSTRRLVLNPGQE